MEALPLKFGLSRAEAARAANFYILEMAEKLNSLVRDERPIGFFCECGCMEVAEATVNAYRTDGGAWVDGHPRRPHLP